MWVARVPVPVELVATGHADENFGNFKSLSDLTMWNIYSPVWAPVSLQEKDGKTWLTLADKDPFDISKVERKIPPTRELSVEFDLMADQNDYGNLLIEFVDDEGTACARLDLTPEGEFRSKGGARYGKILNYEPGKPYHVKVDLSLDNRNSTVYINGEKKTTRMLFAPVKEVERVVFRTGPHSNFPNVDTEADQHNDMLRANDVDKEAVYRIANFKSSSRDIDGTASVLKYDDFSHHADYFNDMEDENIAQAIPNSESSEWMKENIPLFECPDKDMEEIVHV